MTLSPADIDAIAEAVAAKVLAKKPAERMTRTEAAAYIGVSVRTFADLRASSPLLAPSSATPLRWTKAQLDTWMAATTPALASVREVRKRTK